MIRISVICKDAIDNVSSQEVQATLREAGYSVEQVKIHRLSPLQYEEALRR